MKRKISFNCPCCDYKDLLAHKPQLGNLFEVASEVDSTSEISIFAGTFQCSGLTSSGVLSLLLLCAFI